MSPSMPNNARRDKPILSCAPCRERKLRCDRHTPCSACVRRSKASQCIFNSSQQQREDAVDYRPLASRKARRTIDRLEALVVEMRGLAGSPRQPSNQETPHGQSLRRDESQLKSIDGVDAENIGNLSFMDDRAAYTGSSHWVTILDDIEQLKNDLSEEQSTIATSPYLAPSDAHIIQGTPVNRVSLLNSAPCFSREQILDMMPPRKFVDRHISHFFNTFDLTSLLLHRGKFFEEYTKFWNVPSSAPTMWVGLLFSVLSMSVFLKQQDVGGLAIFDSESQRMLETFRSLTINCLLAGGYLRPTRYTMETLVLHYAVDQNTNMNEPTGNWVLIGVIIRIAMRMGLHRDPSHWPNIKPLDAELRRRLWTALYQMDFFTSTNVGLPRIIKDSQCDTRPPAHLFDSDLGPEHDEMPPERPSTDPSPLLHIIQRNAIIKVTAAIYDATEAGPSSAATLSTLDAELQAAVSAIPTWSRFVSLEASIAENPTTILNKMFLDILIHKAVYLLHRRSFVKGTAGEETKRSNELCVDAALDILDHQRRMTEETQDGGLLSGIRWKVTASLNHESLQATMMLCLALSRESEQHVHSVTANVLHRREDVLKALANARQLWENCADEFVEAKRAAAAIGSVMRQNASKAAASITTVSDGSFDQLFGLDAPNCFNDLEYGSGILFDTSFLEVDLEHETFERSMDLSTAEEST